MVTTATLDTSADLILVGGVPGAGKSTAIRRATADLPKVVVLDPENLQLALSVRLPYPLPYRAYRWIIHVAHTVQVVGRLLLGPVPGQRLVVHDPGTRRRRRRLFMALAKVRGWQAALVYVDVNRVTARTGQHVRGRVLRASTFDRHWAKWEAMRVRLLSLSGTDPTDWHRIVLVDRDEAAAVLRQLCTGIDANSASRSALRSEDANDALIELRASSTRSARLREAASATAA